MPSIVELKAEQRRRLFLLLAIKEVEGSTPTLEDFIAQTRAEMVEEDVAYVEKQVYLRYRQGNA